MKRTYLMAGALALLILVWALKHFASPTLEPCAACDATGHVSCGAPDCRNGRVTCTGPCLRKDTPGWQEARIEGHPPELLWKGFTNSDGSVQWVSQNHLGQVMEEVGGRWTLTGLCRVCDGKTRMPCPSCQENKPCPRCRGRGLVRSWF